MTLSVAAPPVYASFWRRFNAYGIDATIVLLIAWGLDVLLLGNAFAQSPDDFKQLTDAMTALQTGQSDPALVAMAKESLIRSMLGGSIIGPNEYLTILVSAIYNIFFVASTWQATPGKKWLHSKIVHKNGAPLTVWQSAMRHALSGLSMLPMGLGCLTIFYTRERLAPHDMLCHTRVVRVAC
jgi:uncharacterized RDD family membrane protein YckC